MKIENDVLQVTTKSFGAELVSIFYKGHEYLWNGDAKYWKRNAPVLFPIVGKLKDNKTLINGREYFMTQHGFARDLEFETVSESSTKVEYLLKSSDATLEKYPYEFELYISYEVIDNRVRVNYKINNKSNGSMLFSIGGHPAFRWPLEEGTSFEDYYLEFEKPEVQKFIEHKDGLIICREELALNNEKIIPLSKDTFSVDTLMYENLNSKTIALKSNKTEKSVILHFDKFPFLGVWSRTDDAQFICLEPWFGIADEVSGSGIFSEKKGIMKLGVGETFECSYDIELR